MKSLNHKPEPAPGYSIPPKPHTTSMSAGGDSRRQFLKGLSASIALMLVGCAPVRYYTGAYDNSYCSHRATRDAFLHALVSAVVPGCDSDADSIRIFTDDFYPFAEHLPYFLADIARRSQDIRGYDRFDLFTPEEQTAVIRSGLEGDVVASKLYNAAIFMAQASVYAGIYTPEKGSPLIDFPGTNMGFSREEMCYSENIRLIGMEATNDGIFS